MEKYAVYVRVSTDRDEQVSSVENQIDICRNWLERSGYAWDERCVYKDEGISGTLFVNRTSIQILLRKAKRKEIDMVVFKSISRLARDLKDSLEIREVFLAHGVRIISVEEGYDSSKAGKNDMAFELWSLFSAQYSRTLSSSISAALAAKVRRGEHIGKVPYGYKRVNQKLVIEEEEAKTVRQIYQWYIDGWGFITITKELNRLGVKPKVKDIWQMSTVQRMIRNPLYKGTFILNQYTNVKVGGRKKQIRNPIEKWLVFSHHHPAIIDEETWDQANQQTTSQRTKKAPWNEFRNLAKCGVCGFNMVIVQSYWKKKNGERTEWKYLKCSRYRRTGKHGCVNHVPIQYKDFREFILKRLIEKGESVSLAFQGSVQEEQKKQIKKIELQIKQGEGKKKNLVDLYLDQLITKGEFEAKRMELEHEMEQAHSQLLILQQTEHVETNIRTIQEAFRKLEVQNQDLYHVFQTLIKCITVHQDGIVDIVYTFENPEGE